MSKTPKKAARKSTKTKTSKPALVKMGVPTVAERLATIERSVTATAAALGIYPSDEIGNLHPNVKAVTLSQREVLSLTATLSAAWEAACLLQDLPVDILAEFAPTYDQRKSFEKIEVSR